MEDHEIKIKILEKYYKEIQTEYSFFIEGTIPEKRINNAIKKFAPGLDKTSILGLYDTTMIGSGKSGYIFTDAKVYYMESSNKPKKLWYNEIKNIKMIDESNPEDNKKQLQFVMKDGRVDIWKSPSLNKTPLLRFFNEILDLINQSTYSLYHDCNHNDSFRGGAMAAGLGIGAYGTINKSYNEEKFHARQGHGFAAERANDLFDKLTGHDAKIVGDNNALNGADRIVDGVEIQSKYCKSGTQCINECFEREGRGKFRYYTKNGHPMQIEVPSDKYEVAVAAMEEKIKSGQVKGVTNPSEAKNIVRKGHFTYEQAKNIAKAGKVESLTYDAVNGAIIASSAFGVSAVISFACSMWNGEKPDIALKKAIYSGIKVCGTTFITSVLASQLSKAGLNSALVGSSEAMVSLIGPKASAVLVNAFRDVGNIYGAAAMKSAAKLLRGNIITAGITVVLLTSKDIVDIFRGRISSKQLFKNITNTASTVAGGSVGWMGGAAIGSAIFPGIGTAVGGVVGSLGGGAIANKASDAIVGKFIEDDAERMVKIIEQCFQEAAIDYLLNREEAEKIVDHLNEYLSGKKLKDMYASSDSQEYAENMLIPLVKKEIAKRKDIRLPSETEMLAGITGVLEDISDAS